MAIHRGSSNRREPRDGVRVLLVGSDPLARAGLWSLLTGERDLSLVGEVGSGNDWRAAVEDLAPDVAAWDVGPDASRDLERVADLAERGLPVLGLVLDEHQARDALASGARAVVGRDIDGESLSAALEAVARGLVVIDERFAESMLRPATSPSAGPDALTPRELEVLELLAQGLSNKDIADRMAISGHTAKFHVTSILSKLGARSRSEAIVIAARRGLVVL